MINAIDVKVFMKMAMEEFQRDRNDVLGDFAISDDDNVFADSLLALLCSSNSAMSKLIEKFCKYDKDLVHPAVLTIGWYDGTAEEQISQRLKEGETDSHSILQDMDRVNLILFRESFIRYSFDSNLNDSMKYLYDIDALEKYAISGCKKEIAFSRKYKFFHDTGVGDTAILHPCYEVTIVGYILTLLAGVIVGITTSEYNYWRRRRRIRTRIKAVDELSLILFESRLRYETLFPPGNHIKTADRIDAQNISVRYLEMYIPVLKKLRHMGKMGIEDEYLAVYAECRELAEKLIPDEIV